MRFVVVETEYVGCGGCVADRNTCHNLTQRVVPGSPYMLPCRGAGGGNKYAPQLRFAAAHKRTSDPFVCTEDNLHEAS